MQGPMHNSDLDRLILNFAHSGNFFVLYEEKDLGKSFVGILLIDQSQYKNVKCFTRSWLTCIFIGQCEQSESTISNSD